MGCSTSISKKDKKQQETKSTTTASDHEYTDRLNKKYSLLNGKGSSGLGLRNPLSRKGNDMQSSRPYLYHERNMDEYFKNYDDKDGIILGEGMTGVVKVAKHKSTGEPFAVKSINYSCLDPAQYGELINEIRILKTLEHPNVVRLKETYQNDKSIVLVMEYLTGGDLSKRRLKTEYDVIRVIGEVLSGLQYCHSKGIVHRDLKLQNIVFASPDEDSVVKIIDFGLSRPYMVQTSRRGKKERIFTTQCGTVAYMSPEILKGRYTKSCDLWAVGVIMYALLTNRAPFSGDDDEVVKHNILSGKVSYKNPIWKKLNKAALPLVKGLLQVDPEKRLTAEKALESPWFDEWRQARILLTRNIFVGSRFSIPNSNNMYNSYMDQKLKKELSRNKGTDIDIDDNAEEKMSLDFAVANSLKKFSSYSKIKKLAMMIIAHHLPQKKLGELQTAFLAFDENGSGTISLEEFKKLLARHGPVSDEEAATIFNKIDINGRGEIDYPEFLAATIEIFGNFNTQALLDAFNHLDIHNTGLITKEGLSELAGGEMDEEEIEEIIREADTSKDGKVSKEEFLQAMLNEVKSERNLTVTAQLADHQSQSLSESSDHITVSIDVSTGTPSHEIVQT